MEEEVEEETEDDEERDERGSMLSRKPLSD
jgi:hypothetical protein